MAIPKIIHQTFKSSKLPFLTRWHISRLKRRNPEYSYEFYDDERILKFLSEEYGNPVLSAYQKLNIGAAKADFFRYAVLYKKGGVYLDIDCKVNNPLDEFIRDDDSALLSPEKNPSIFVQWAMIYEPGHPFLKRTLEMILDNIANNSYPHDVHRMTGPYIYTNAINDCLNKDCTIPHRIQGIEYAPYMRDKYKLAKFVLYQNRSEHWKIKQVENTVLRSD